MSAPTHTEAGNAPDSEGHGHFFAVDRYVWGRVCAIGLNPAVGYLVLARILKEHPRTNSDFLRIPFQLDS